MLFDVALVLFCTAASVFACLPFLNVDAPVSKDKPKLSWHRVLRFCAGCVILMLLCSTACRKSPRYSGFFVALCLSFYFAASAAKLVHVAANLREYFTRYLLLLVLLQSVLSIASVLLCKTFDASLLLVPILLAPVSSLLVYHLQRVLCAVAVRADAKKRLKKMSNLIRIAVVSKDDDDTCAYLLQNLLDEKSVMVQDASALALADTINERIDSTVRTLIFPLSKDVQSANRMLRLAPPHVLVCCDGGDVALAACRHVRNGGAVVADQAVYTCVRTYIKNNAIVRLYTTDAEQTCDYTLTRIRTEYDGMHFVLKELASQQKTDCRIQLLGKKHVSFAAAAITAARLLGMPMESIVQRIASVPPKKHALDTHMLENGALLIDDTAHDEPLEVQYALETLDCFSARKIVVLGSYGKQAAQALEKNKQIGHAAAYVAHQAVICGDGADAVQCGLLEAGFALEHIHYVQSAAHLRRTIDMIAESGDVILQVLTDTFHYMEV